MLEPYHDDRFLDTVKRRSVSLAEDIKREVTSLTQLMTATLPDNDAIQINNDRPQSLYNARLTEEHRQNETSITIDDEEATLRDDLDSPASSTGRDSKQSIPVHRPSQMPGHNTSCDLEAQDSDDSIV